MPTRRDFLATAASTGLLATLPIDRALLPHGAERASLGADGATLGSMAVDDTDLSWVARLRGKSRAVFDSPQVSEGGALFRAALWRQQVNKALGTPLEELTPVVVFRHEAIPLIMDDEFWSHLGIGKDLKWKDEQTRDWTKRNPLRSAPAGTPEAFRDFNIPAFIKSGGVVLGCGLAFREVVSQYKDKDK